MLRLKSAWWFVLWGRGGKVNIIFPLPYKYGLHTSIAVRSEKARKS
jgi:hypothetical protein